MAFNLLHFKWQNAIHEYVETGDIRSLGKLVRNEKIPDQYRPTIADILDGTLAHKKLSSESARSFKLKQEYLKAIADLRVKRTIEFVTRQFKYELLRKYPIVMVSSQYSDKLVIQHIANEFYQGNYESARRIIHRKIVSYGWQKLPNDC